MMEFEFYYGRTERKRTKVRFYIYTNEGICGKLIKIVQCCSVRIKMDSFRTSLNGE